MSKGGKRLGAGRPKGTGTNIPTKVIRIPNHLEDKILKVIKNINYSLPYYSSRISAGFPSPADDYIENTLDLNEHLIKNPISTFFVEVTGESMLDAGIQPKDILVVDKSITPSHGKIAIVYINNEFTVKKLNYYNGKLISLIPENKNFKPIVINENDEVEIWGIVTYVIHKT